MKFCPKCNTETERNKSGKCRPCAKARVAAWKAANPEQFRATHSAYRAANREQLRAKDAAYRAANLEKVRAAISVHKKANPEKHRIYEQNRRARKKAVGGALSPGLAEKLFKLQKGKCPCCNQPLGDDYHMDHIVPVALLGANTDGNIQLLRALCNRQKSAKDPIDFMQQRGFLL